MVTEQELQKLGFKNIGSGSYEETLKRLSMYNPREVRIIRDTELEPSFDIPYRFHVFVRTRSSGKGIYTGEEFMQILHILADLSEFNPNSAYARQTAKSLMKRMNKYSKIFNRYFRKEFNRIKSTVKL